jgi:uncharacterized membrane protein
MVDPSVFAPPRRPRTSTAAVLGFVLSLVGIAPIVLVLSVVGLLETRDRDLQGRWLAVAGTVIGALGTVVLLVWLVLWTQSRG